MQDLMDADLPMRLPPPWALFLDVDGTLIEHAESPAAVVVDSGLRETLTRLRAMAREAVALISGRALSDLDRMFRPLQFAGAGQHGLEVRDALGYVTRDARAQALNAVAVQALRERTRHLNGVLVEDKGLTVALHYRRAPYLRRRLQGIAQSLVLSLGEPYQLIDGSMAFEIKPGRLDKGSAVEHLLRTAPFRDRLPIYIGNDTTDEDAFEVVNAHRGITIKVGYEPTRARHRAGSPRHIRAWLNDMAALTRP